MTLQHQHVEEFKVFAIDFEVALLDFDEAGQEKFWDDWGKGGAEKNFTRLLAEGVEVGDEHCEGEDEVT